MGAVTNLAAPYLQCGDNAERLAIVDTAKFVNQVVLQGVFEHFIGQCAGRAKLDLFDYRGRGRAVHVDPRLLRHIENRRKAAHAFRCMDADGRVVADH